MLEIEGEAPERLLHRDVTEKIIGASFEVHRELGYGVLERVYQRALQAELLKGGSAVEIEKRLQVRYKHAVVGDYDCDLIVNDCVIVELKVNPHYDRRDEAQLLNLLKATGIKVGLLINFGRLKVEYNASSFNPCFIRVHPWPNSFRMNLSPEKKIAGVLAPLFALRREKDLGIGDLEALRQFIDWAAQIGFKLVQLLPINEMGGDHSPYNAISAVALEPTTLYLAPGSPEDLTREDFDEVIREVDLDKLRKGPVKHARVRRLKLALLKKAHARFARNEEGNPAFEAFCKAEAGWLDDYAFFRALMEEHGGRETWDHWPKEHQDIARAREWLSAQPEKARQRFSELESFFKYVQWVAWDQWRAIRAYAEARGVALMGDIPFGVNLYSADVYAHRDQFAIEWSGGAPPEPYFKDDEFTQKWGQNWGIPLYRWDVMRARNLDWWRWRVRGVRKIFHVFRIDHVLGFYRIYAFPWRPGRNQEFLPLSWDAMREKTGGAFPQFYPRDDLTRENGEANRHEGEAYLRAVLEESGETRVVGEDLGTVPDYVRPSLRSLGIAGFKIPQWENHPDGRSISGQEYQRVSVATYATHDHKPLRAMWEDAFERVTPDTELARQDLGKIAQFAGVTGSNEALDFDRDFYGPVMEGLFRCESWLALVMITDLLARKDRFNVPGTATSSNWSRRMSRTVEGLRSSREARRRMRQISELLEKTGRL